MIVADATLTPWLAYLVRQFDHRYTQMTPPTGSDLHFDLTTFVGLLRAKSFLFLFFLSVFFTARQYAYLIVLSESFYQMLLPRLFQ